MSKYEILYADDDGWSRWSWPPRLHPARVSCCGCGLVHDIDIAIHKVTREGRQTFEANDKPTRRGHRVRWRWRVNKRATARVRRHMKAEDRI